MRGKSAMKVHFPLYIAVSFSITESHTVSRMALSQQIAKADFGEGSIEDTFL